MSNGPVIKFLFLKHPLHMLAIGFGAGLSPIAPGTCGTLVAIPFYWMLSGLDPLDYFILLLSFSVAGVVICDKAARDLNCHDHPGIVWDEMVGFWLTMFAMPAQWLWVMLGFCLFRFFDIVKPWPIRWFDRQLKGGFGIMADDLLAGLMAWVILQGVGASINW